MSFENSSKRRFSRSHVFLLISFVVAAAFMSSSARTGNAQTEIDRVPRLDVQRALKARATSRAKPRKDGFAPERFSLPARPRASSSSDKVDGMRAPARLKVGKSPVPLAAVTSITPGTSLARVLHTSQLSINSAAGSNEQYVDSNFDLIADQRTTFDAVGGSFDIAVGRSNSRYEVYSATNSQGAGIGVLVAAVDSNGDYVRDGTPLGFDLGRDFGLPSAVAVVSGTSKAGREFVIASSSGYFNSANPSDPNNEPSAGVVLLVRNVSTPGFDNSLSRALVSVGSNQLNNANALALLPNNDLLIGDFDSHELRIVRDTNNDGIPDTLDANPYYSYQFSDDGPLDIAANSRGVVFSHGFGNDTIMLAIYDDNKDGHGDTEAEVVRGLSLDNNLILHGLTVDREGTVYIIEDASGAADTTADGGNLGSPAVDAFPDPALNGFLRDGALFSTVDQPSSQALSGLAFGVDPFLSPVGHVTLFNSASRTGNATYDGLATISGSNLTFGATGMTEADAVKSGVYVTVEGQNARVLSFNNSQINIYVPQSVGAGTRSVLVFSFSDIVAADDISVAAANPGIFTTSQAGGGEAIALLASALRYTMGPFDAMTLGQPSVVVIYGTGWRNSLPVTATVGGRPATVQFAGPAGDFPGLDEVVLEIPSGATGNANVVITAAGGAVSRNDVFIPIR